jgi:hypothetical protein
MVGAGGTGTHLIGSLLPYLDRHHRDAGTEWQCVIIDGDAYDAGNLERQLFDPTFVTTNKAEAMAQTYARYPVIAVPRFIGRNDLQQMMDENDTAFIAADNHSIRALVQERALQLRDSTIISAGNELHDGNVQLFVRRNGKNETPPITFLHPEIVFLDEEDRSGMSCQQVAEMPGGGQLILANAAAALHMLTALYRLHYAPSHKLDWTELQFDLLGDTTHYLDMRKRRGWARN